MPNTVNERNVLTIRKLLAHIIYTCYPHDGINYCTWYSTLRGIEVDQPLL
jgi:hypothetical protein